MSMARSTRPTPASVNVRTMEARSAGCSNPSVRIEEPLSVKAVRRERPARPQNIAVYPSMTRITHTASRTSRLTGA